MMRAMAEGKYSLAASEALDSKWAVQVGQRSKRYRLYVRVWQIPII
jgi:hypothetical protein